MLILNGSLSKAQVLQASSENLRKHVQKLCGTEKPRTYKNLSVLNEAADYIFKTWTDQGYTPEFQTFQVGGKTYKNVILVLGPKDKARIVLGAHYDVAEEGPGADDNASGVAGLLELSRLLKPLEADLKRRVELVAYSLEEPPFFGTAEMGSAIHAAQLKKEKAEVALMVSLEMIGYYSDKEDSQSYPLSALKLFYPTKGSFISVIGDLSSPLLVRKVKNLMKKNSSIEVESLNAPTALVGVDFSDHRNYWNNGYPAVMITDTAFFRNQNYHALTDKPETLDYGKMAEVVQGVLAVAREF
jgi:Zn-dependent M28 family amino/carboxypeptidase